MNTVSKQKTIKKTFSMSGVGLHTGKHVTLTFKPAPENHGYQFQKIDVEGKPIIKVDVDNVVDTARGTTIGDKKGNTISTIEHLSAAIVGLEIDNILVQINGAEVPILDGSAQCFIDAFLEAGIKEQEADKEIFEVDNNIYFVDEKNDVEMVAMPFEGYRVTVMVDYNSTALGSQHATIANIRHFRKDIASSRTFVFLHELKYLLNQNLIKGGDLNNAIVIVDKEIPQEELKQLAKVFNKDLNEIKVEKGILNNLKLRHQNEPARHKLLDLVGDLALVGLPIKAQIMAARPGHASNVAFAKKIKEAYKLKQKHRAPKYDPNQKPVYDINQVTKLLPHRFPFLLVDKIIKKTETSIIGIKNVTMNEYFFQGHFPNDPIMPGVLIIEAMAQTGGILVLSEKTEPEKYSTYFLKIDKTKFKGMVRPGDTLIMKLELISPIKRGMCYMKAEAYVGEKLVTEAEVMAQVVKNK